MMEAQRVYGPDRDFSWSQPAVPGVPDIALGGNQMFLLPEDTFDRQPLWTANHSACLVADVRLDNRVELARTLGLTQPEQFADSAVLLAAWQRWGEACLNRLAGGFAFAVWTPATRTLFAARDHVGERPLFFVRMPQFTAVASMPCALLALPGVFRGFNEPFLADTLVTVRPQWGETLFQGVERVPTGHWLRITPDELKCVGYWDPIGVKPAHFRKDSEYEEATLALFDQAVGERLRSTRGIGSHLSAGLDSSSVTASAARQLAPLGRGMTAFTSVPQPGFTGSGLPGRMPSEGPGAASVAAMYPNVEHVMVSSEGGDLWDAMIAWTRLMQEPAQNCTNLLWIATILHKANERGLGVMLQAAFGNATVSFETPVAHTRYFRTGRWIKLFRLANNLRNQGDMSFKASLRHATAGLLPVAVQRLFTPAMRSMNLDFSPVHPRLAERYDLRNRTFGSMFRESPTLEQDRRSLLGRFDFGTLNAASRALARVDPRDPMGDRRVIEFCYSLPVEQFVAGGQSRSLVRRVMRGRLPPATLGRYIRGQQGADWHLSHASALADFRADLELSESSAAAQHMLDLPRLKKLLDSWPDDGYGTRAISDAYDLALTRGIITGHFLRTSERKYGVFPLS